jgi:predicted ribosomally synthesized peptide with SipW-like signal peptide
MKRTRVIALVLCAAIMLMGAGYAYWSDTLTINNTVSTGELNVEFLNTGVIADPTNVASITWATADVEDEVNNISFTASNLYPGASVGYTTTIANTGTIPAVLKPITFSYPAVALTNANGIALTQLITATDKANFIIGGNVVYDGITIPIPSGITLANIESINLLLPQALPAGKSVVMNLTLTVNPNLTQNQLENSYINANMTLNWKQHNNPN